MYNTAGRGAKFREYYENNRKGSNSITTDIEKYIGTGHRLENNYGILKENGALKINEDVDVRNKCTENEPRIDSSEPITSSNISNGEPPCRNKNLMDKLNCARLKSGLLRDLPENEVIVKLKQGVNRTADTSIDYERDSTSSLSCKSVEQNISLSDDYLMEDSEDELIYTSMKELCLSNSYRQLHEGGADSLKHGKSYRLENRNLKTLNSNNSKALEADVIGEDQQKVQGP